MFGDEACSSVASAKGDLRVLVLRVKNGELGQEPLMRCWCSKGLMKVYNNECNGHDGIVFREYARRREIDEDSLLVFHQILFLLFQLPGVVFSVLTLSSLSFSPSPSHSPAPSPAWHTQALRPQSAPPLYWPCRDGGGYGGCGGGGESHVHTS